MISSQQRCLINKTLLLLLLLFAPTNANAHGEEVFLGFNIAVALIVVVIMVLLVRTWRLKIILSASFLVLHCIGWMTMIFPTPSRMLMKIALIFVRDDGSASFVLILAFLYIIPLVVSLMVAYIFKHRKPT